MFAPFSLLRFGAGDEIVMNHLRAEPEAILYALSVVAEDAMTLSELLLTEAGIDGIYYCVQGGEKSRFTVEDYRKWITPSDLQVLEHANRFKDTNVLHCCGWAGIPNNLEVWKDYPAKAINWACFIENMSLARGRVFFNGKCVLGGFDNRPSEVLFSGTKSEVEDETMRIIDETGIGGLILGADCTLPADVDVNRFKWVIDKVISYT